MTGAWLRRALLAAWLLGAVFGCGPGGTSAAFDALSSEAIGAHVSFLASDLLEGRAPSTQGEKLAALYIASQFEQAGLIPAVGDSSFLQPVPLLGIESELRLSFRAPGGALFQPERNDEIVLWSPQVSESVQLTGPLVFAGHGIVSAEHEWDDFKGVDLEGAVLMVLAGDPEVRTRFHGDTLSRFGLPDHKFEEAARRGAAGVILIHRPEHPESWQTIQRAWTERRLRLAEDSLKPVPALEGWLSQDAARQLVAMAGLDFGTLIESAQAPTFRPIATGLNVSASGRNRIRRTVGYNVVGKLAGVDSTAAALIYLAHYDGEGYGRAIDSDSIYNGCYRNASGTGLLIGLAHAFARLPEPTRRSILFLAVTAHHPDRLGSRHYVRRPVVSLAATAAAINIDGASLWGRTTDVVVLGTESSDLDVAVARVAAEEGLRRVGDPLPELGRLYRSDHLPFMRAGIPVAYVQHGVDFIGRMPGWGRRMLRDYGRHVVRSPDDECTASTDFGGAEIQARLAFRLGLEVANRRVRPRWHAGSEYRAVQDSLWSGQGREAGE
ncbi:MAG: M28 family peptidase [Gemmatimonadetes bacterium]|uniref:M28 family peptidase n=1 Tax=Candidatus Kutchimonas denitrificans TaxID=3056748 RepID=A0AAE4ZCI7_9BACT|nr:M28 family peptidase [Gemmatimonadota bacterium]NIR75205.1 M28 family peptidase [Candidatus Kutchimonas denitrificans]NIS00143.1 M28 family peptidase [Gemmatimonadota bacterium]NIT65735.1 M28 family peptidase [Gemmatimonadota bacterium]NIU53013.1 M28 family peptidase [Gemmatimonadota bacterium]